MKAFLLFLLPTLSYAGLDFGMYTAEHTQCHPLDVYDTTYVNGIQNPVNERVQAHMFQTYSLRHPVKLNAETGTMEVDINRYEDVVASERYIYAIQIEMKNNLPDNITVYYQDLQSSRKDVFHCSGFVKDY